ncbi:nucleotidyltransferase family protein [Synechococcus sp. CCY 9618]|uniref:nucleotidyltransferase family protein n=1 Tax=Synechococcus sp. CCY 9618 TaxID=2815602 RepID=UPI001C211F73|nr:nucleotidyltransferase domain-containing protein [Synechococcus sp. CCY 9618]
MRLSNVHRRHWEERQDCDSRLLRTLPAARRCALSLQRRWPAIEAVGLFGSTIEGRFRMGSDIDLAVEGMTMLDLLDALGQAEATAGDIPVDLVRLESLPPHWQQRIRDRAQRLL